jgi:L-threonylcarbamoyladenylate synthase
VSTVEETLFALRGGELVVVPTDTVYGLACRPDQEEPVRALSLLKRRSPGQPIALVAAGVDALVELIPELPLRGLVAGPFTLVVANPERRLPWLTGARPDTIGVRIPVVTGPAAEVLAGIGVIAATSANLHGAADPKRFSDVSTEILEGVGAALDGGDLPGTPSTVIDLTGHEPRVLREGAVLAAEALARVAE